MNTKPWEEAKATSTVSMRDELWMLDEIDGLRDEACGLEAELRAWRKKYDDVYYNSNGGEFYSRRSNEKMPPDMILPNGVTVAELKKLLRNWPETDEYGDPCEVWLCGANGLSNQARQAGPLNMRRSEDGTKVWADLMFEHDPDSNR